MSSDNTIQVSLRCPKCKEETPHRTTVARQEHDNATHQVMECSICGTVTDIPRNENGPSFQEAVDTPDYTDFSDLDNVEHRVQPSIDFKATVKVSSAGNIEDAANEAVSSLKDRIDSIERITRSSKITELGLGFQADISGTILLKHNHDITKRQLQASGVECFNDTFKLLPMFTLITADKDSSSAKVHCRKCKDYIGDVPNYFSLLMSNNQAQIKQAFQERAIEHLTESHSGIDPSSDLLFD